MKQASINSLPTSASLPDFLMHMKEYEESESSVASDDDDDSDSNCSDWSGSFSNLEERATAFSAVGSTPAFAAMVFGSLTVAPSAKKAKEQDKPDPLSASNHSVHSIKSQMIPTSRGADFVGLKSFAMRRSNSDVIVQASDYNDTKKKSSDDVQDENSARKPDDVLQDILTEQGLAFKKFPAQSLEGFFLEMGSANIASYGNLIATAVRVGDLDMMKEHQRAGGTLQCCNKFHESILHTICRRGHVHLLKFILEETDVSIRLRDDYGRTPLHDAAWTDRPNFELVTLLLKACPDLLLITDQRGFTPMAYVGRQRWEQWCVFLEQNKELLTPKVLLGNPESCIDLQ